MKLSPKLTAYFKDYDAYHRTKGNKYTHFLGIPLIVVTLFGLLEQVAIVEIGNFEVNAGVVLGVFAFIWYFALDQKVGLLFSIVLIASYWIGGQLSTPLLWILFIAGWIAQFIGHLLYEKNRPAFFRNLQHVMIGPLWIFCDLTRLREN